MVREVRVAWDEDDGVETDCRRAGRCSLPEMSADWDDELPEPPPSRPARKPATKRHLAGADWLNWSPPKPTESQPR